MLGTGEYQRRSAELGEHMLQRLTGEAPATVREVRGRGLWAGVEVLLCLILFAACALHVRWRFRHAAAQAEAGTPPAPQPSSSVTP